MPSRPLVLVCVTALIAPACLAPSEGSLADVPDPVADAQPDAVGDTASPPPVCSITETAPSVLASQPGGPCRLHEDADATTWVGLVGPTLWRIRGDGEQVVVHNFGYPAETHTINGRALVVRGRYAFAAMAGSLRQTVGDAESTRVQVLAVDLRDGSIVLKHGYDTPYRNAGNSLELAANARGVVVVGHQYGDNVESRLLSVADGLLNVVPGALPLRVDADAEGRFAALQYPVPYDAGASPERRWVDPCAASSFPVGKGSRMFHRDRIAIAPYNRADLEIETATSSARLDVGSPDPSKFLATHPSGVALLARDGWPWAVVDFRTAGLTPLEVTLPSSLKGFGYPEGGYHLAWAVTSRGEVLSMLRDDEVGHAYRTTDGASWDTVGAPVGETTSLEVTEQAGTYVLHAPSLSFYVTNDWAAFTDIDGPARLDGLSVQLVRPESGVSVVLHGPIQGQGITHSHDISEDGLCMQHWLGDTLEFVDAETGEVAATYLFTEPQYPGLYAETRMVVGEQP